MKVVVFGATGKTGRHVWRKALAAGHEVTVFARSAGRIGDSGANLRVVQGDVLDAGSVAAAVAGQDAAVVCLGSVNLRDRTTLSAGTGNVVDGLTRGGGGRLVVVSAAGVGESWKQIPLLSRLLFRTLLRNVFSDHHAQERLVRDSPLDWTIVRPGILKDEPAAGACRAGNTDPVGRISREDVADFLVGQLEDGTWTRQAVSISSPVDEAARSRSG